jgi:hypothetical protein
MRANCAHPQLKDPNAAEAATQSVSDHRVTCAQVARIPN